MKRIFLKGLRSSFRHAAVAISALVLGGTAVAQGITAQDLFSAQARAAAGGDSRSAGATSASVQMPTVRPSLLNDRAMAARQAQQSAALGNGGERDGIVGARALKKPQANEFQKFLAEGMGQDLPLFGADLFLNPPSTFAPAEGVPVAPDYVVGPGDEVMVRAWGQVDIDVRAPVDRNGLITIPSVGAVPVAGVRFQELQGVIAARLGKVYRNFELSVTMGQLGGIQVFVVGQANAPGSYTIGSTSTLISALFAAGGPSAAGSMRNIQVRRANKLVAEFDLYAMLLKGDASKDVRLRSGDVIFIPPVGRLVAVTGSVNMPAVYELKDADTSVADVLGWAGGLTTTAKVQKVTVERIRNRSARQVEEVALTGEGGKRVVQDGDVITVYAITPKYENTVALRGFVAQPARYPWREGLRVKDLIPDRDALVSPEYWRRRNDLLAFRGENLKREALNGDPDSLRATPSPLQQLREAEAARQEKERIDGLTDESLARGNLVPVEQTRADRMGVLRDPRNYRPRNDLRNLEEISWDYAVIERLQDDLTTTLVPFNLGKAVLQGDPQHNIALRPGDIITVFSKSDIQVPADRQRRFVRLEGEFHNAGIYQVQPGETLRQLVVRVGGVTASAYMYGAEFTRESTRITAQKQLDESIDRLEREVQRVAVDRARNGTSVEDIQSQKTQLDAQQALVTKLKKVRATGRVVLEMPAENANLKDLPDLPLEDGDRLYIPPQPSVVSVFGAVYNQNAFIYRDSKRADDYLVQAGGPTRSADEGAIYVLRADGTVVSKRQKSWFGGIGGERVMPGDAIVVPEDFTSVSLTKELKDWSQILYQFALGVAGLKVLKQ